MLSQHSIKNSTDGLKRAKSLGPNPGLHETLKPVLRSIFSSEFCNIVFVGSAGASSDASYVTLELAREAARFGYRVLLIECPRQTPLLAAAMDATAFPMLVDIGGSTLVAMPDTSGKDFAYLAPVFCAPEGLISRLSQCQDVEFVKDVSQRFDLILIDGNTRAADAERWLKLANKTILVSQKGTQKPGSGDLNLEKGKIFVGTIIAAAPSNTSSVRPAATFNTRRGRAPNRAMSRLFKQEMKVMTTVSDQKGEQTIATFSRGAS